MNDISKIVPEVFYDLIGHLTPGFVALALWPQASGFAKIGDIASLYQGSPVLSGSLLILGASMLVVAYTVGHLIGQMSYLAHSYVLPRISPSCFAVLKDATIGEKNRYPKTIAQFFKDEIAVLFDKAASELSASRYRKVTFLWYDWVRLRDASAGTRLMKMRAEYRMVEGLFIVLGGTLLLSGIAYALEFRGYDVVPPEPVFIIACAIAFAVSPWGAARRYRNFQWAVINQYYHLKSQEDNR